MTSRRPGSRAPKAPLLGAGVLSASPGAPEGHGPPLWIALVSRDPAGRGGRRTGPGWARRYSPGARLRHLRVADRAALRKARPLRFFFFFFFLVSSF